MTEENIIKAVQELCNVAGISNQREYIQNEINWLDSESWNWDLIKNYLKKLWNNKEEYFKVSPKWFFLAHSNDRIIGKPQLIDNIQKNIPLIRLVLNKKKVSEEENKDGFIYIQSFYFFDERFDKRYDGIPIDTFTKDFRLYRLIDADSKEYYIFSKEELPNCVCEFKGMFIPLEDLADVGKNLKLKSISKAFILKDFTPSVKILDKEELINFTKEKKITKEDWFNFINYHPQGTYNIFPEEVNLLRSSFLLSGEDCDYPLHLFIVGRAGTKKSMGHIETLAYKFDEGFPILEGGNSRMKGLTPSFKEKPANLGYLANMERIGFIDELGKMVEFEMNKHDAQVKNVLGECNFLLEHKKRLVGSGNDNNVLVQANAKFLFVTNPLSSRDTIAQHIGLIDPTTLSRMFVWVQDNEETNFLLSGDSVSKEPIFSPHTYAILDPNLDEEKEKKGITLKKCWGKINREEYLTLFDTCNSFMCKIDDLEVERLTKIVTNLAKEPMKSSVWKPRGLHHTRLLIDGLVKQRCLFEDYTNLFIANKEDYDRAERILIRMVNGWETNLSPKELFK